MTHRLYRSRTDRVIGGVCGGIGQYFGMDTILIRLLFILVTLAGGAGFLVYILMLIVVPEEPLGDSGELTMFPPVDSTGSTGRHPDATRNALFVGGFLVFLGGILLLQNVGISLFGWMRWDIFWPVLIIAGGIALLLRYTRGE